MVKNGPATSLTEEDEDTLVKYLKYCASIGYVSRDHSINK